MPRVKKPREPQESQQDMVSDGLLADGFGEIFDLAGKPVAERPKFTGEQVMARRPETAKACLDYIAGGMPVIKVARLLGLSPHTVRALRDSNLTLAQQKQRLGALQLFGAECAAESIIEDLSDPEIAKKIPTAAKAVVMGILNQRSADNLSNGVTVSVQLQVPMTPEQYQAALRAAASPMGSGAQETAPKGDAEQVGGDGFGGPDPVTFGGHDGPAIDV